MPPVLSCDHSERDNITSIQKNQFKEEDKEEQKES